MSEPLLGYEIIDSAVTAAGTTQDTATQLISLISIVTTVPPSGGVKIIRPAKVQQIIVNAGTNPLAVWPLDGMALFPATVNTAIELQPGRTLGLMVESDAQGFILFNTTSFG